MDFGEMLCFILFYFTCFYYFLFFTFFFLAFSLSSYSHMSIIILSYHTWSWNFLCLNSFLPSFFYQPLVFEFSLIIRFWFDIILESFFCLNITNLFMLDRRAIVALWELENVDLNSRDNFSSEKDSDRKK